MTKKEKQEKQTYEQYKAELDAIQKVKQEYLTTLELKKHHYVEYKKMVKKSKDLLKELMDTIPSPI